ncbi:putative cysteine proteinase CG12163 isoform X1 [Homalodisca vitripennis]|uniref:putative cysteine proteinase CG12163 isoform X1 n=1 Tax=Homalodisca vitripennis TaxID=197043 RepID=UPI001EEB886A|nr:putative cysteine proteinase CG12163 isoform X1 [Homalodisca vitripennis]
MSAEDPSIPNTSVDNNFIEFQKFIKKFEREYRNFEEFELRYKIFLESLKSIDELNNAPGQTATFGVTHFADRTEHEKKRNMGVLKRPN